jgi:NAD(P)-dependent dehydrogenase (short-subunit alcohol dehydrogenase family)
MHITDLKDKQVLITGAASGIGLATAEAFARRGARLILTDLNADHLAAAQRKIQALGAQCHTAQCDAGNWQLMQALAADIQSTHGAPDVLINNAGIAFLGGVMEHSLEHWQKIFQVNVMGVVHGVWAFLPAMRAAGGPRHIVNIASAAAVAPAPNMSAYAASKAAVRNFGEVLAMELDGSNILVQSVYPGFINTAIVSGVKSVGANISQRQLDRLQRHYQIKGCNPSVVAEDIVRGVLSGKAHVFTGPMAKLAHWLGRLSPRWLRAIVIRSSRQNGYLASASE